MPEPEMQQPLGTSEAEPAGALETEEAQAQGEGPGLVVELAAREGYIGQLEEKVDQLRAQLEVETSARADLQGQLEQAVSKYREAALAAAPKLPADLVTGTTVEEVEQALAPAGIRAWAPPRSTPDLSALSPQEKVALGPQRER